MHEWNKLLEKELFGPFEDLPITGLSLNQWKLLPKLKIYANHTEGV